MILDVFVSIASFVVGLRKRRTQTDTPERRADRAQSLVMMGEVSAGRHALEGAPLAPGIQRTLDPLRDPVRRPTSAYAPLPEALLNHHAERTFSLDKTLFLKNLKRARRGAAAGPSGVTAEHMKSVWVNLATQSRRSSCAGEWVSPKRFWPHFAFADWQLFRSRMGACAASWQAVCSEGLSQNLGAAVGSSDWTCHEPVSVRPVNAGGNRVHCPCHPGSYRSGPHSNRGVNRRHRSVLTSCLAKLCWKAFWLWMGSVLAMPFVLQFYGSASSYMWEDEEGVVRTIVQAEGGEQGDPLMPALFSLGQHPAVHAVQAQLQDGERLFAFLDDVYVVCAPPRVNTIYGILQHELFTHSSIRIHHGKTQVWNRGSVAPYDQLLEKVLTIQDLQCAWLLLPYYCGAQANCTLRVVHSELTAGFAAHHDASLRRCLSHLLGVAPASIYYDLASLPLCLGGLGLLRSATFLARPAFWASWADCLEMIHQRRPTVCARIVDALHAQHPSFHLDGVRASGEHLASVGFHAPSWLELAAVLVLNSCKMSTWPGIRRHGWQRTATEPVHGVLMEGTVRPRLSATEKALFRSQGGPLAGIPFMCFPTSRLSWMDSSLFRVLFLRRLWLPLPPSSPFSRCGSPLDPSWPPPCSLRGGRGAGSSIVRSGKRCRTGVSRSRCTCVHKCAREGLGPFATPTRRCSSAGGRRRRSSALPRSTDRSGHHFGVSSETQRHPAQSLCLGRRCRFASSPQEERASVSRTLRCTWKSQTGCSRKWSGRQMVLGHASFPPTTRTGGVSWGTPHLPDQRQTGMAWRWSMILACASARAFAKSLLENRAAQGFDGPTPTTAEVIGDSRYAGFAWRSLVLTCVDWLISSPFTKKKCHTRIFQAAYRWKLSF